MVNGGLGLLLASDSSREEVIAYGVVAAVLWVIYVGVVVFGETVAVGKAREHGSGAAEDPTMVDKGEIRSEERE